MVLCWLLTGGRASPVGRIEGCRGLVARGIPTQQPRLDPQGNPVAWRRKGGPRGRRRRVLRLAMVFGTDPKRDKMPDHKLIGAALDSRLARLSEDR